MANVSRGQCIVLQSRPGVENAPSEANFGLESRKLPQCGAGGILVKTLCLSVDPYMRCRMNEDTGTHYLTPWSLGEPPNGGGVGMVTLSKSENYKVGDVVESSQWPWQEFASFSDTEFSLNKVESAFLCRNPSLLLGIVGVTGLTSYFGIREKGHIKPGCNQTVVVSGAAGACGMVAGQIAKLERCGIVIGICGTDEKCRVLIEEMGFDFAINYKKSRGIRQEIMRKCRNGVDVYFDNVGGDISNEVICCMNSNSHIVLCGQISVYNKDVPYPPPLAEHIQSIVREKNVTRDRFLVLNYMEKFPDAKRQLETWVREGKLKNRETVARGLENTGKAFVAMMSGKNIGKQVVMVAEVTQ